jgi:putative transposase
VLALRNQVRRDIGRFPSLSANAVQALSAQYTQHPGWTAQLHHDNLRVTLAALGGDAPCASYPSVRRYLKAQGLVRKRPPRRSSDGALAARDRLEQLEVRSYEVEHVLQLLHLDFHHGSRKVLTRKGEWVKPLLVGFIDDRSRLLCHLQWYTHEGTEELVHGLCQALQKVGLPRSIMTDRGSAMISGEFTAGLHHLGILHLPTLPYSPHVNGKQENLWGRVEGRLLAMLEGRRALSQTLCNAWDWRQANGAPREMLCQTHSGEPAHPYVGDLINVLAPYGADGLSRQSVLRALEKNRCSEPNSWFRCVDTPLTAVRAGPRSKICGRDDFIV